MTAVGEHYHPAGTGHHPGEDRVVGTGDPVALLRVVDDERRRGHERELLQLLADALEGFGLAADPDSRLVPGQALNDALSALYWRDRRLLP